MKLDKKKFYFLFSCISLVLMIVGATFAYFTASKSDQNTVKGNAATVTFSLVVNKVTSIDMAYGLVPMKPNQAPNAAIQKCKDDLGNAGCQIYKITVTADSDTVMFLDGYIVTTPRVPELETRFVRVFSEDEETFNTSFTNEDMNDESFVMEDNIKTGVRKSVDPILLNHADDSQCLLVENQQIGGDEFGRQRVFYVMMWVHDDGKSQDYLQGMELAYRGEVVFLTAEGNQISATFD